MLRAFKSLTDSQTRVAPIDPCRLLDDRCEHVTMHFPIEGIEYNTSSVGCDPRNQAIEGNVYLATVAPILVSSEKWHHTSMTFVVVSHR